MPTNLKDQHIRNGIHLGGFSQFRATGIHRFTRPKATLSGTLLTTPTEAEVVTGGQTVIITLTEGIWKPAGTQFNAQRQAIIDNLLSDGEEVTGWNTEILVNEMGLANVVRTSDTVVTIDFPAAASYAISADETVTVTVPGSAVVGDPDDFVAGSFTIVAA